MFTGTYVFLCFLMILASSRGAKTTQDRLQIAPSWLQEAIFSLLDFEFDFGSIWGRFWMDFGSLLAPFWQPLASPNRAKFGLKLQDRIKRPQEAPRGAQEAPKRHQKGAQEHPKGSQEHQKRHPRASKRELRAPKRRPRAPERQ